VLSLTVRQIDALRYRWRYHCPPPAISLAIIARWRPPLELTELPDGSFAEAKAANDDWFKDPSRFFAEDFAKPKVGMTPDG
jgi:hypothetical protein